MFYPLEGAVPNQIKLLNGVYTLEVTTQGKGFAAYLGTGGGDLQQGSTGPCYAVPSQATLNAFMDAIQDWYSHTVSTPTWADGMCGGPGPCKAFELKGSGKFGSYSYNNGPSIKVRAFLLYSFPICKAEAAAWPCANVIVRFETDDWTTAYNAAYDLASGVNTDTEPLIVYIEEGSYDTGFKLWTSEPASGAPDKYCDFGYYYSSTTNKYGAKVSDCCPTHGYLVCNDGGNDVSGCACCSGGATCVTDCGDQDGGMTGCGCYNGNWDDQCSIDNNGGLWR